MTDEAQRTTDGLADKVVKLLQRFSTWQNDGRKKGVERLLYFRQGMGILVALGRLCEETSTFAANGFGPEKTARASAPLVVQRLMSAFNPKGYKGTENAPSPDISETRGGLFFSSLFRKEPSRELPPHRFQALAECAAHITENYVDTDSLIASIELSLLRKTSPKDYENVRKLYLAFSSAAGKSTPVALATQTLQDLHPSALERVNRAVTHHKMYELSKLFRFPLFSRNADYFNLYVLELLRDPNRLPPLTPTSAIHAAVLAYAMAPEPVFHELIKIIVDRVKPTSETSPILRSALVNLTKHANCASPALNIDKPTSPPKRLKIALCLSGQMRGFRNCAQSLDLLGLSQHDTSTFVHTWKNVGRRVPDPKIVGSVERVFESKRFCKEFRDIAADIGATALDAQFPKFFEALKTSSIVTEQDIRDMYGPNTFVRIDDEADTCFKNFSNQDKMHYKIWAANEMATQTGEAYDLIIRLRPDKPVDPKTKPVDWVAVSELVNSCQMLFTEEAPGLRENLVIGDQFAISSMQGLHHYAKTWTDFRDQKDMLPYPSPRTLQGHTSLGFSMFQEGYRVRRMPWLVLGRPQDESLLNATQTKTLLALDIDERQKTKIDRKLMDSLSSS